MPSTESNLRDNTTLVNNNTTTGLLQTIQVLKQDLNQTRGQRDQIENQLSCLISLVKRSWMGDKVALFHVANIIGMPVPTAAKQFEEQVNPQTRAKMNWERLSSRLLDREYQAIQEEIKERQQHYINYREDYMDEILNSHQEQMAQLTLHKQSNNALRDVDRQFMKSLKPSNRPPTGKVNKCPPAAKRPGKVAEDIVDKIDIGLGNLLFTGNPESLSQPQTTTDHKRGSITECIEPEEKSNGQYDDSHRYSKTNLFDTKDAFGSEAFQKKKRPCSASELRKKDKLRSRPKSAITGLKSGKADRPLKFETTQPVSGKTSAKTTTPDRRGSLQDSRQARNSLTEESLLFQQAKAKAELKSRIKSATQRPRDIDTYEDEVKNITDMENRFKQNAVDLQKKLGINRELKSGKADRPLKFETTEPVSGKTSAKTTTPDRRGSLQDSRQARNSLTEESLLFQQAKAKAELKSRIKSATQRPRDIDTYEDEVKNITDMENRFKQNAVELQKKLGINTGMIY